MACLYFSSFCLHFFLDRPLVGPFLEIPDRNHKYNVINDRVVPPREMKVPCYDVDINHHFQGLLENIEELKQLSGSTGCPIWIKWILKRVTVGLLCFWYQTFPPSFLC